MILEPDPLYDNFDKQRNIVRKIIKEEMEPIMIMEAFKMLVRGNKDRRSDHKRRLSNLEMNLDSSSSSSDPLYSRPQVKRNDSITSSLSSIDGDHRGDYPHYYSRPHVTPPRSSQNSRRESLHYEIILTPSERQSESHYYDKPTSEI